MTAQQKKKSAKHHWWRLAQRLLTAAFLLLVIALIATRARDIAWDKVFDALRSYEASTLLLAAAFAAASHLTYSGYDLLARAYTRHGVRAVRVVLTALVSFAFNLNFGSTIGGIGFRWRLYSQAGLRKGLIARIVAFSLSTNWLGIFLLTGGVFLLRVIPLPASWGLGSSALQLLGAGLLLTVLAYLAMSAFARRRTIRVRRAHIDLPPLRMALGQLALSVTNWLFVGLLMYSLLHQQVKFPVVLGVLLTSCFAGVLIRVPAGLGVVEAVFLALLSARIPTAELLAALFAYRAIYYLGPLLIAIAIYLALEAGYRRAPRPAAAH